MNDTQQIELFLLKCAVIERALVSSLSAFSEIDTNQKTTVDDEKLAVYIKQFDLENRQNASRMSKYYEIFYMIENDIRKMIIDTLYGAHGPDWWTLKAPQALKDEAKKNRHREEHAGVSPRSDNEIEYITFGQLWDLIRENWADFAGIMSNHSAVGRVLSGLNMLRGTIAHCGTLAEDEVDRLKLAIKDWFRVLEGPK